MSVRMESVEMTDMDSSEGDYRFIVDGKYARYVRIESGVYSDPITMRCESFLLPLLPEFPSGNWNRGTISCNKTGQPFFSHIEKVDLPSVKSVWHTNLVDILTLELKRDNPRAVRRVLSPQLFDFPVIAKYVHDPFWTFKIEDETAAYKILEGTDICPRFMGHLTENGRVMGFLLERLPGRPAREGDFEICRGALEKLHKRGIKHGDVNRQNFLVQDNGEVKLIDFSEVEYNASPEDLAEEISDLKRRLSAPPEETGIRRLAEDGVTLVSLGEYVI